jgi:integrase
MPNIVMQHSVTIFRYPLVFTAFRSGLRIGELLGLKWEDVDFKSCYLMVQRSYDRHYGPPKHNRTREVDMCQTLCDVLKDHRKKAKLDGLKLGLGGAPEPIFYDKEGKPLRQNHIRWIWALALAKAGIRFHKLYSTRSAFASQLLTRGADLYYVSKQLGHHSIKVTEESYLSWIPEEGQTLQVNLLDATSRNHPATTASKRAATH